MANVVHPPIDFHRGPVAPNLGFGFGMGSPTVKAGGWQQPAIIVPGHNNPAAFHQLASFMSQASPGRAQKRRHDPEDDSDAGGRQGSSLTATTGSRDDAMDRSPTPERPKKAPPKRARVMNSVALGNKEKSKENKPPGGDDGDVDVGVLLASLPPQSLLPLLTSLLNSQPSLKSTILPLIPRPTLETAIEVLTQSAKKLRDAYPYSNSSTFSTSPTTPSSSTTSFGFGSGVGSARSSTSSFGSMNVGFGRPVQTSMFGQSQAGTNASTGTNSGGMRDSYILSRLRPHITEFVSTCMSYLPYFSCIPIAPPSSTPSPSSPSQPRLPIPKERVHPSEIYLLLSSMTSHILSQPPLTQSSLAPLLLPRLHAEWLAWVDRLDVVVNTEGGMFGGETVKSWEKGLDQFADVALKGVEGWECMKEVRERWVSRVGWLVGRRPVAGMDMEEL